mgnify:CR=1 FL=1|jgi:hypothetical protein
MKTAKVIIAAILIYAGIVIAFESMIGIIQPEAGNTLIITTTGQDEVANDRVLARLETDGHIYVAANHWPRAWYRQALANPNVQATIDGTKATYTAVPIDGTEHRRVHAENDPGVLFRILTSFPPRRILRLDPK